MNFCNINPKPRWRWVHSWVTTAALYYSFWKLVMDKLVAQCFSVSKSYSLSRTAVRWLSYLDVTLLKHWWYFSNRLVDDWDSSFCLCSHFSTVLRKIVVFRLWLAFPLQLWNVLPYASSARIFLRLCAWQQRVLFPVGSVHLVSIIAPVGEYQKAHWRCISISLPLFKNRLSWDLIFCAFLICTFFFFFLCHPSKYFCSVWGEQVSSRCA